jgi:RimJ/RimL family protein N-acetyltransferase
MALDDLDAWAEFCGDPECTRYLIRPEPKTREESAEALTRWIDVGMSTLVDGDEIVGWSGYVPRTFEWGDDVELGWLIRKTYWGQGYASEAALTLRAGRVGRLVHLIHPENAASIAVVQKLSAEREREVEIAGRPVVVFASVR